MDTLLQDLRFAVRNWARRPMLATLTSVILAVGIGLNATVFSLVNGLLLRPLPYPDADRIVRIDEANASKGTSIAPSTYATFSDLRGRVRSLDDLAAYREDGFNALVEAEPERIGGTALSANALAVLRVQPALGRGFNADEDRVGAERVVVIGHELWTRHFDLSPTVLGRAIVLDGERYTIVGVMPAGFHFDESGDVWVPLAPLADGGRRDSRSITLLGRLRDGATIEQARAEIARIGDDLARTSPATRAGWTLTLRTLGEGREDGVGVAALLLMGAVVFVLLIACANVANLMLAQAAARHREVAVRLVLGAARGRVVRQMLTEGAVLAAVGGVLGMFIAVWAKDVVVASLFPVEFMPASLSFGIDWRVIAFTTSISLATVLAFALTPALQASKTALVAALKDGSRGATGGARGRRTRALLVGAQVAFSLVLLVGAGLMIESAVRLQRVDRGYDSSNVLTARITVPEATYPDDAAVARYAEQAAARVARIPGVEHAAVTGGAAFTGGGLPAIDFAVDNPAIASDGSNVVRYEIVSPDYFSVVRVPLLRGRGFTGADRAGAPMVAIVNETMARQFWPDESPLGRQIRMRASDPKSPWITVVGLARDVRVEVIDGQGLRAGARPGFYVPFAQAPDRLLTIEVRTREAPMSVAAALRRELSAVDATMPVYQLMTLEQSQGVFVRFLRSFAVLFAIFGALALALAAVGVYGVVSYSVTQRTHEIGIRMAIGASATDVVRLVVRQGMTAVLAGVGVGLAASLALTRLLAVLLYGVRPADIATYAGLATLMSGVALLATYLPARRATKVEPVVAMRSN